MPNFYLYATKCLSATMWRSPYWKMRCSSFEFTTVVDNNRTAEIKGHQSTLKERYLFIFSHGSHGTCTMYTMYVLLHYSRYLILYEYLWSPQNKYLDADLTWKSKKTKNNPFWQSFGLTNLMCFFFRKWRARSPKILYIYMKNNWFVWN